ncbi:hypothetical protein EC5412_1558, partial [Escherichia coli 5412]
MTHRDNQCSAPAVFPAPAALSCALPGILRFAKHYRY